MKIRLCLLLLAVSSWMAAQSVHLTVPAVDAFGATVTSGTAYFTWQPFVSTNGTWVPGSQLTRPISGGTLDVTLSASDNAGYVYTVLIMNGVTPSSFRWKVPAAGATTMGALNQVVSAQALNATAIQGNPFKAGTPAASQTYIWNATTKQFELSTVTGGGVGALLATNNLSDLASAATARINLGLGTAATAASTAFENPANKGVASGYAPLNASSTVPLANLPTIPFSQLSGVQASLGFTPQNAATANANNAGIGNCPTGQFATGTAAGSTQPCATPATGTGGTTGALLVSNNLSDLASAATARTNLGLGTAATLASTLFAGVGNCPTGQFATGTAAGTTQPCATPAATGSTKLPLNTNYAISTNNTVGGGAPFTWLFNQGTFSGTVDTQSAQGYNICLTGV